MKKLFTLLTLMLLSIGSAWAQDETLFLWRSDGSTTDLETSLTATGGTIAFYGTDDPSTESAAYNAAVTDDDLKATGSKAHKLGKNTLYLKVTLSKKLQKNDVIYICGYNPFRVGTGVTSDRADTDIASSLATGTAKSDYNVGTITVSETIGDDVTTIYISRANGSGTGLAAIKIVRPAIDLASPTIDTDLSTTPIEASVGVGVVLSIEASHVTSYQWYSCDNTSKANPVAISGATAATYSYTPATEDAESTKYFYCEVTNSNATGTKTAASSVATVNVAALPTLSAVTNAVWDFTDWSNATYSSATIINNLELKNVIVDGNNKSIDGYSLTKRAKTGGTGSTTDRYVHFKVTGPCVITVYGMSGKSGETRTLAIKIADTEVATLSNDGNAIAKVVYKYTASGEADVYLYSQNSGFNIHGIVISRGTAMSASIGSCEWATFSSTQAVDLTTVTGLKAYKVTGFSGSAITKEEVTGVVPANTGLLLNGVADTYEIPVAATAGAAIAGNKLVAVTEETTVSAGTGTNVNYVLVNNSGNAEFQWIGSTDATVPAGRAYLTLADGPKGTGARLFIDDTTGIGATFNDNVEMINDNVIYDLSGRRVENPTKGIYIMNGKKVVIR